MRLCGFEVGLDRPLFLIAGPCVLESADLAMDMAGELKEITARLGMPFVFKAVIMTVAVFGNLDLQLLVPLLLGL